MLVRPISCIKPGIPHQFQHSTGIKKPLKAIRIVHLTDRYIAFTASKEILRLCLNGSISKNDVTIVDLKLDIRHIGNLFRCALDGSRIIPVHIANCYMNVAAFLSMHT